jgi:flagellar biosynthesis protein FlhF
MKVKKYVAANSREAMKKARAELGAGAVVLSSCQTSKGFELLALAKEDIAPLIAAGHSTPLPAVSTTVDMPDSYQPGAATPDKVAAAFNGKHAATTAPRFEDKAKKPVTARTTAAGWQPATAWPGAEAKAPVTSAPADKPARTPAQTHAQTDAVPHGVLDELRALRGMVQEQSARFAWTQEIQQRPLRGVLLRELMSAGFSPALGRRIAEALPDDFSEDVARKWTANTLERNLNCTGAKDPFERGGVFALVGSTGVGKTTTTAKLAARCVVKYGADSVGLVSADHYRIGAQDQLRIFGKILGVPVQTVHDAESLRAVLAAMAGKRLVLIDTIGVGQRDPRVAEQNAMMEANGVRRVLLLSAASQAETLEEIVRVYSSAGLAGAVLTKVDEAATLGGALDTAIRHKLSLTHITTGQRVPEDIHPANALYLVQRALKLAREGAHRLSDIECGLLSFGVVPQMKAAAANARG